MTTLPFDILLIIFFFIAVVSYVLIFVPKHWFFKALLVGVGFFIASYSVYSIMQFRGYPVDLVPDHRVRIVHLEVVKPDYRGPGGIYMMVFERDTTPRTYRFPYDPEDDKEFGGLKKKLETGSVLMYHPPNEEDAPKMKKHKSFLDSVQEMLDSLVSGKEKAVPQKSGAGKGIEVLDPQSGFLNKGPDNNE